MVIHGKSSSDNPDTTVLVVKESTVLRVDIPNTLGPFAAAQVRRKSSGFPRKETRNDDSGASSTVRSSRKSSVSFSAQPTAYDESPSAQNMNSSSSFQIDIKTSGNVNYSGSVLPGLMKSSTSVILWSDESEDAIKKPKSISFSTGSVEGVIKDQNSITDAEGEHNQNRTTKQVGRTHAQFRK